MLIDPQSGVATTIPEFYGANGNGVFDNATAFNAFRAAALALNASSPNTSIVLNLSPKNVYAISDIYSLTGIKNLIVQGNGAAIVNINASIWPADQLTWFFGGPGLIAQLTPMMASKGYLLNITSYRIASASVGATGVTTLTPADAANMVPGQWALVSSSCTVLAQNPPSMRYLDYVKILTVNASTGAVTFDRALNNFHNENLPIHFISGDDFTSAANIFPMPSQWNCRQIYRDTHFLQPTHYPGFNPYALLQGLDVILEDCTVYGGYAPSQVKTGYVSGSGVVNSSTGWEIDRMIEQFSFSNCNMGGPILGVTTGGQIEFDKCVIIGNLRAPYNSKISSCTISGNLDLSLATNIVLENNNPIGGSVQYRTRAPSAIQLTVDGTTVTYASNVITIPYTLINTNATVANFIGAIWEGCRIDHFVHNSNWGPSGDISIVKSITDDATNVYLYVASTTASGNLANGTVLVAPWLQSYSASGNQGPSPVMDQNGTNNSNTILNGDLSTAYLNRIARLIAPFSGDILNETNTGAEGRVKSISINVIKPYTGALYIGAGSSIQFRLSRIVPASFTNIVTINLKTAGQRLITQFSANGNVAGDTIAASLLYIGNYSIDIAVAVSGSVSPQILTEDTSVLPIIELGILLEDERNLIPYL